MTSRSIAECLSESETSTKGKGENGTKTGLTRRHEGKPGNSDEAGDHKGRPYMSSEGEGPGDFSTADFQVFQGRHNGRPFVVLNAQGIWIIIRIPPDRIFAVAFCDRFRCRSDGRSEGISRRQRKSGDAGWHPKKR